jgi:hypothetical protein
MPYHWSPWPLITHPQRPHFGFQETTAVLIATLRPGQAQVYSPSFSFLGCPEKNHQILNEKSDDRPW